MPTPTGDINERTGHEMLSEQGQYRGSGEKRLRLPLSLFPLRSLRCGKWQKRRRRRCAARLRH
eukprot:scaffold8945_cov129-Isochrysis_galbana.AAC.1